MPRRRLPSYGLRSMAPHVLVADDDAWILRMVATVLEKRGYSVETAGDGEDALNRAAAARAGRWGVRLGHPGPSM